MHVRTSSLGEFRLSDARGGESNDLKLIEVTQQTIMPAAMEDFEAEFSTLAVRIALDPPYCLPLYQNRPPRLVDPL